MNVLYAVAMAFGFMIGMAIGDATNLFLLRETEPWLPLFCGIFGAVVLSRSLFRLLRSCDRVSYVTALAAFLIGFFLTPWATADFEYSHKAIVWPSVTGGALGAVITITVVRAWRRRR